MRVAHDVVGGAFGYKMKENEHPSGLVNIWDFIGEEIDSGDSSDGPPLVPQGLEEISAEDFEEPCAALGTSGGTAAFYCLRYREQRAPQGVPVDFFIGKDLAHASDELEFYAKLQFAAKNSQPWTCFAKMAMSCPGVSRLECINPKNQERSHRLILLLENLRQGFNQMRLLDIKLCAETSVACWKGKSRLNAWKNQLVDQRTNSVQEGFRLEGIEGPPKSLEDRIHAVMDPSKAKGLAAAKYISPKVIKRFTLQRLRSAELLEFWLDMSHLGVGSEQHAQHAAVATFQRLRNLLMAVMNLEVPQQWIGSSVALAAEVGSFSTEPKVLVKVFDWGRAELNTEEDFQRLQAAERESRSYYWRQYLRALGRLYWELGRVVLHRCCSSSWSVLVFELRAMSPAVVRAALLGELGATSSVTMSMGLFQMDPKGGAGEVSLPLLNQDGLSGSLRMHVQAPSQGVGTCRVQIYETQTNSQVEALTGLIVTVRAVAFERAGDARVYLEAFQSGCPAPSPRGHVCCQSTPPATASGRGLHWNSAVEFRAGATEAAQAALEEVPIQGFGNAELLPPSIASTEEVEEKAQLFLTHLLRQIPGPPGSPNSRGSV